MQVQFKGLEVASSKETEAMAILTGLEKARATDFDRVHMLMDAKEVVQALKRDQDWSIGRVISEIKTLATLFRCVEFDYTPRAQNVQPYMLAKFCFFYGTKCKLGKGIFHSQGMGLSLSLFCSWYICPKVVEPRVISQPSGQSLSRMRLEPSLLKSYIVYN